jgi:tRNA threonylcarbamoyladenosine biosynthesis protein TsaB
MAADDTFPVVAAIDARHAHVYLQVFSPGGRTLTAPRLAALREAVQAAAATSACIVGSAAQSVAAAMSQANAPPAAVDARAAPDIAWVARMGAVVPEGQSPPKPQYLRAPDAQPQNAAQLPRR